MGVPSEICDKSRDSPALIVSAQDIVGKKMQWPSRFVFLSGSTCYMARQRHCHLLAPKWLSRPTVLFWPQTGLGLFHDAIKTCQAVRHRPCTQLERLPPTSISPIINEEFPRLNAAVAVAKLRVDLINAQRYKVIPP